MTRLVTKYAIGSCGACLVQIAVVQLSIPQTSLSLVDEWIVFLGFSENDLSSTSLFSDLLDLGAPAGSRLDYHTEICSDPGQKGKKRRSLHSTFSTTTPS